MKPLFLVKPVLALLVLGAASLALNVSHAHGSTTPKHGGIVQMVGETSFELVAGADGAELYLVDDGEDLPSDGMTGKLTVVNGETRSEATLTPAGGNKLQARGVKIASGSKVAVLVTLKDQVSKRRASFSMP